MKIEYCKLCNCVINKFLFTSTTFSYFHKTQTVKF